MIQPLSENEFMTQMGKAEQAGDYSESAVERFWDWMYGRRDGIVQVCAFPVPTKDKTKDEMGEGKWVHSRSLREFKDFCSTHSGLWRYHVYAGVNTLHEEPEYGRGSVDHINRVHRLTFDIETERDSYGGASRREVWWTYRYALAQVKYMAEEYDVLPLFVMSENGVHLHYRADFPCTDEYLQGRQHTMCKYITYKAMDNKYVDVVLNNCPSDITIDQDDVSDPPRVMKVPGTRGIKSDTGRLCGIIHEPQLSGAGIITESDVDVDESVFDDDSSTTPGSLDSPRNVDTTPSSLGDDTVGKVKRLAKNDSRFRQFWKGKIPGYESRSEAEFAFVIKMLNHGFDEQQIVDIMWASGMSKWGDESSHYRERTVENAIDYFDGTVKKDAEDGSYSFSYE
jgi:hypothetical protein